MHAARFARTRGPGRWVGIILILVCSSALLSGCKTQTSGKDISFVDPEGGTRLVAGGGGLRLGAARKVAWVDPRTAEAFAGGHIPGAVSLPYQELTTRHHELESFDIVIVYGDDYNDPKAMGMSKRLLEMGHEARTLRGGLRAWADSGREIATE